jgi:hypothetical protein
MAKNLWRIWTKALGAKISDDKLENDFAAIIRTLIVFINAVCCIFIEIFKSLKPLALASGYSDAE